MSALSQLTELYKSAKKKYYNSGANMNVIALHKNYSYAYRFLHDLNPSLWPKRTSTSIDDKKFDAIEAAIKILDPKNKALGMVGAPVQGTGTGKKIKGKGKSYTGDTVEVVKGKVKLPFYMGSLDKVRSSNADKWLAENPGPYLVMDKLDGISVGFDLGTSKGDFAYTRGDGTYGLNVSHYLPTFDVPEHKGKLRGELVMSLAKFDKKWSSKYANSRNMVSGIMNRHKVGKAAKDVTVFIFESISPRGVPSQSLAKLKAKGFNVVPHKVFKKLSAQALANFYELRKAKSKFAIDGLVIVQDVSSPANKSGNPTNMVAFKVNSDEDSVSAKVVDVIWRASKYGYLKPRVRIEPVRISGAMVEYATGHNAKFIVDNGIGKGAEINIVRSGEVIPYIEDVTVSVKPILPDTDVFGTYSWSKSKVDLIVDSKVGLDGIAHLRIESFLKNMGVEFVGGGTIPKFYDHGLDTIDKWIKVEVDDLLGVEGIGKVTAKKIVASVQKAMNEVYLPQFMKASGMFGRNLGASRLGDILEVYYPEILLWDYDESEITKKILKVKGFKHTLASQFAKEFNNFIKWFKPLNLAFYYNEYDQLPTSNNLSGQRFYLSGFRDSEISEFISSNGGEEGSFGAKTTTLIIKEPSTNNSKVEAAKARAIPILTRDEFRAIYLN